MTDAEILERLRAYFQNQINNLNATEMAEGPFEDGTEDGELWEQAASRIDARGGLRIRFEFGDTDSTGESTALTQLRRQLEDAESTARLTKAHYIRRCERLTKARDDRQAMLDRAATLMEAGKTGGIESWSDQADGWLREYRATGLDDATADAAQQWEERAVAEARPHDDEESTPAFEDRGGQVYLNGTDAW